MSAEWSASASDPNTLASVCSSAPPRPVTVAEEAISLTGGDRRKDYGDAAAEFGNVGRTWGAILSAHLGQPIPDIPADVMALMMVSLKVCREAYRPKRDNRVDLIGYAICADRCPRPPTGG